MRHSITRLFLGAVCVAGAVVLTSCSSTCTLNESDLERASDIADRAEKLAGNEDVRQDVRDRAKALARNARRYEGAFPCEEKPGERLDEYGFEIVDLEEEARRECLSNISDEKQKLEKDVGEHREAAEDCTGGTPAAWRDIERRFETIKKVSEEDLENYAVCFALFSKWRDFVDEAKKAAKCGELPTSSSAGNMSSFSVDDTSSSPGDGCPSDEPKPEEVASAEGSVKDDFRRRAEGILTDLEQRLEEMLASAPPDEAALAELKVRRECAKDWMAALGDAGIRDRLATLGVRIDEAGAIASFRADVDDFIASAADLDPADLGPRFASVEAAFGALPSVVRPVEERRLNGAREAREGALAGMAGAAESTVRGAVEACDQARFDAGLEELRNVQPSRVEEYERLWLQSCGVDVAGIVADLEDAEAAARRSIAAGRLEDGTLSRYLGLVDQVDSMPEDARALVERQRDLEGDRRLRDWIGAVREGDRALESGRCDAAAEAFGRAENVQRGGVGPDRLGRVAWCRGQARIRSGDFDGAWSLLGRAERTLGAGVVADALWEAATEAGRRGGTAAADAAAWYRRAAGVRSLDQWPPAILDELVTNLAGTEVPGAADLVWMAFVERCGSPGERPSPEVMMGGALAGHALGRNEEYLALARRTWPEAGDETAIHIRMFDLYLQLASLAAETVDDVRAELDAAGGRAKDPGSRRILDGLLTNIAQAPFVVTAALPAAGFAGDAGMEGLIRTAEQKALAFSADRRLVAASRQTGWGPMTLVYQSFTGDPSRVEDHLAVAAGEALALITAIRVQGISSRTDRTVGQRRIEVRTAIERVRTVMRGRVAYMGLFERDGRLSVPEDPKEFFLASALRDGERPVFRDEVSRKALEAGGVLKQNYSVRGIPVMDIAVPIRRGGNKVGVLRVGVRRQATSN